MSNQDVGGAYSPPPDDYDTFDARDAEQDRRGWLFLGASAVVFVLFVAVVYNTFQLGVRDRADSPIIAPDAEPYRVAPEDPGGYQAPDQDLSVTSLREGGNAGAASAESAAPVREVSEEPIDPPERDLPALRVETADADALDSSAADEGVITDEVIEDTAAPPPADPDSQPVEPEPRSVSPDPVPQAPAPAASEPSLDDLISANRTGGFVAQVAAYRSAADAEAGWINFVARFPELATGRAPDIQRADLGERGVFHRLRIAAFETRADAAAFCDSLSDRGQACLVATR